MSGPFGCQLIELTKKMASKLNYKKQTIYTIISEHKNEFIKFNKVAINIHHRVQQHLGSYHQRREETLQQCQ
jgi:hypothetical protein